jgi:hypothetical protein
MIAANRACHASAIRRFEEAKKRLRHAIQSDLRVLALDFEHLLRVGD